MWSKLGGVALVRDRFVELVHVVSALQPSRTSSPRGRGKIGAGVEVIGAHDPAPVNRKLALAARGVVLRVYRTKRATSCSASYLSTEPCARFTAQQVLGASVWQQRKNDVDVVHDLLVESTARAARWRAETRALRTERPARDADESATSGPRVVLDIFDGRLHFGKASAFFPQRRGEMSKRTRTVLYNATLPNM